MAGAIRRLGVVVAVGLVGALLSLAPAGAQASITVSGTVVGLDGSPLDRWAVFTGTANPQFRAITDSSGRFQFSTAPLTERLLFDSSEWGFATAAPVSLDGDVDLSITVPLDEFPVLVIDDSTGEPIVGRQISITAQGEQVSSELSPGFGPTLLGYSLLGNGSQAHTDASGIARLTAPVGDATGTLRIGTGSADPWSASEQPISLSREEPAVFRVPRLREVEVVVTDAGGTVQPGVRVSFSGETSSGDVETTGPDGAASLVLGPGPFAVEMTLGAMGVSAAAHLNVEDGDTIVLMLPPLVDWQPRVIDGNGDPVPDTSLRLGVAGTNGPEIYPGSGPTESWQRVTKRTDADGLVDLPVFDAGDFVSTLSIFRPTDRNLLSPADTSPAFGEADCCTYTLWSLLGGVSVVGGGPVAGQTVEVVPVDGNAAIGAAAATDTAGEFALAFDSGTFDVIVRSGTADDRLPRSYEVVEPGVEFVRGRTVDVRLPVVDVAVSVVDHLGQPIDAAVIEGCGEAAARPPHVFVPSYSPTYGSFCDDAISDSDGQVTLKALHTPSLAVSVEAAQRPDLEPASIDLHDVDGATEIEVVLRPRTLTPGAALVTEGDRWFTTVRVPVRLSSPAPATVRANWRVVGDPSQPGVATPWVDLAGQRGTVTFREGSDFAEIRILVFGDTEVEAPLLWGEWGMVEFSNVQGPALLDTESFFGHGLIIIVDDDAES